MVGSSGLRQGPRNLGFMNLYQVKITLWLTVSQSVLLSSPIWDSWSDVYYCLTVTVLFYGAPSLMRGRVCLFHMLLVLANAVFLGSESLGTRDRILLSQIWDFPFRRLLRLAVSQWRYPTPPPHRGGSISTYNLEYIYSFSGFDGRGELILMNLIWEGCISSWELGNHLRICLKTEENQEYLCRDGRSQGLPVTHWLLASSPANKRLWGTL
jgi:hypothetical protein